MIEDKRMSLLSSEDGIDYYLFKPSLFRLYYDNRKDDVAHRHSFTHRMHMIAYLFGGGYKVLYLSQNDEIVSYIVFAKCKDWIVKGANKDDYYTVFLWTYPKFRKNGYATKMVEYMLHKTGIQFKNFYKIIAKDNFSSIHVAEKSGFVMIGEANTIGKLHTVVQAEKGNRLLFKYNDNIKAE
jgi:RimJ/RimL family protein N-acetyltransferase